MPLGAAGGVPMSQRAVRVLHSRVLVRQPRGDPP